MKKYIGKLIITHQAGGFLIDEIETGKTYKTKAEALNSIKEIGKQIEGNYTCYSNYEYNILKSN